MWKFYHNWCILKRCIFSQCQRGCKVASRRREDLSRKTTSYHRLKNYQASVSLHYSRSVQSEKEIKRKLYTQSAYDAKHIWASCKNKPALWEHEQLEEITFRKVNHHLQNLRSRQIILMTMSLHEPLIQVIKK